MFTVALYLAMHTTLSLTPVLAQKYILFMQGNSLINSRVSFRNYNQY